MKSLRRATALLVCILITLFCTLTASADEVTYRLKELGMSIKIPDTMTVVTREQSEDMADTLYLEATKPDSSLIITVSMIENDKTREIYSFEQLSSTALEEYKEQMLRIDGYSSCNSATYGDVKFLDFDQKFSTDNGSYIYGKQSVTLINGMSISISSQSAGDSFTSDELGLIKSCLESIKFTSVKTSAPSTVNPWSIVLWVVIVIVLLAAAFLALSFYMGRRSLRKKQEITRDKRRKADYDVLSLADEKSRQKAIHGGVGGYKSSADYFDSDFDSITSSRTASQATSEQRVQPLSRTEKAVKTTRKALTHTGYFFRNLRREIANNKKNKKANSRRKARDYDVFRDK